MPLSAALSAWLLAAAGAAAGAAPPAAAPARRVLLPGPGGRRLAASWRPPRKGRPVLVLAHGVGAARGEWEPLARALSARGAGTLCLDLRGHGESALSPEEWRGFDAAGLWAGLSEDLLWAARWVESRGVAAERVAFGGASIGANLAAAADARRPGPLLLLLSPGADYRGARLSVRRGARILAVASRQDPYAWAAAEALSGAAGARLLEAPAGHGAPMLEDPAALAAVLDWALPPR